MKKGIDEEEKQKNLRNDNAPINTHTPPLGFFFIAHYNKDDDTKCMSPVSVCPLLLRVQEVKRLPILVGVEREGVKNIWLECPLKSGNVVGEELFA